jgi:hypothetical protein
MDMLRFLTALALAGALLATASVAHAAAPTGFTAPRIVGATLHVTGAVATASAPGRGAAAAFADDSGGVWAARVRADGSLGSPLPAASGQRAVRDVQVAITERGEIVVVWGALLDRSGRSAVRYAVAARGRPFSAARTVAAVGSYTSATPHIAALRGGTVAVIFRDTQPLRQTGVLRYARRGAGGAFGTARSLGHDGVAPEIAAAPGGGALLAWGQGSLTRRSLEVAAAARGATVPGPSRSVAGRIRQFTLSAAPDGSAWVAWTRRAGGPTTGFARRTRAANRDAVGPVRPLGTVAYGVPHVALDAGSVLAAWNARGPGAQPNVMLAAAQGPDASLGATSFFDAGGFSQTSPIPALVRGAPLVLFTRQIPAPTGAPAEVAAANPLTGETTLVGPAGNNAAPGVAPSGAGIVVAWAARGGGVAVSALP